MTVPIWPPKSRRQCKLIEPDGLEMPARPKRHYISIGRSGTESGRTHTTVQYLIVVLIGDERAKIPVELPANADTSKDVIEGISVHTLARGLQAAVMCIPEIQGSVPAARKFPRRRGTHCGGVSSSKKARAGIVKLLEV